MKNYFTVATLATQRYRLKFNLCSYTVEKKLQQFVPVHSFSIQSNQQCVTDFTTKVGDEEIRCFVFINYQLDLDERRREELLSDCRPIYFVIASTVDQVRLSVVVIVLVSGTYCLNKMCKTCVPITYSSTFHNLVDVLEAVTDKHVTNSL